MQGAGNGSVPWIGGCCWQRAGWTMPVITRFRWIKNPLEDNEKFAIIVKIITPGTVHPVAIEYDAGGWHCPGGLNRRRRVSEP